MTINNTARRLIAEGNFPIGATVDFSPFTLRRYREATGEIVTVNEQTVSVKVFGEVEEFHPLDIWVRRT